MIALDDEDDLDGAIFLWLVLADFRPEICTGQGVFGRSLLDLERYRVDDFGLFILGRLFSFSFLTILD